MEPAPRYEILDTIATGDFATVYRARDRELGREVAIKQIHQQFLGNPRQLERYWHEAQLLASLQHPNIVTIYDIVRSRGWLILELMRGTLQQNAQTGPIDLDYLRASLACCLDALSFLHANGVIHGDVKPSNMLLDAQGRAKLGDFGLARRASSQQGSLLKGTTKYMAPEMVSDQFGPVGPASDLYSLGFSGYELLCGPQFDSLFPGLATFGRDKQIAWLMWHAAPDRKLPPIARVLEGVPEDLARVIERLSTKEQAGRYHSAKAALRDLRAGQAKPEAGESSADESPDPSDRRRRRTRFAAIGAMAVSLVLCVVILFGLSGKPTPVAVPPEPIQGVITNVYPRDPSIEVQYVEGKETRLKSFFLREGKTKVIINQKESAPRHLQKDDRVKVEYRADPSGRAIADVVRAARPEKQLGAIQAIDAAAAQFTLAVVPSGELVEIRVPNDLGKEGKFLFNGKDVLAGKPVRFDDLRTGDQVTVDHVPDDLQAGKDRRVATDLSVLREVTSEGVVRKVSKTELTIETAGGPSESWPLKEKAPVWINQGNTVSQRALTPLDLQGGDKVRLTHDSRVIRVDAERIIAVEGAVVQAVQSTMLEVQPKGGGKLISFLTDAATKIILAGEPVDVAAIRPGDVVDLTHASALDSPNPLAISVTARRTADLTRWAILAGIQKYDDARLPPPATAAADARLLQETMVKRYGVPPDQALLLEDASLARLKEGISGLLDRVTPEGKLVVYFAGHALRDDEGKVFLAPREFNRDKPTATGLALQWLVDRMEECKAKEKLLLLDACQASPGGDPKEDLSKEPSTAEMFQSLVAPAGMAALRTVTGIASCSEGQRGYSLSDGKQGLFAASVAEGVSGAADKNRDGRLEPTELFAFLGESMTASARSIQKAQTAKLFLADNRPPRLAEAARNAIRDLAACLQQDAPRLADAKTRFDEADGLAGKEPDAKLIYALVLLKARQRDEAQRQFATLQTQYPDALLPGQGLAWVQFDKRLYAGGLGELAQLVARIPKPKKPVGDAAPQPYPAQSQQLLEWVGRLREFAAGVDGKRPATQDALQKLDAAVAALGDPAAGPYEQGRARAAGVLKNYDDQIQAAPDDAKRARLETERLRLANYAVFPFDAAAKTVLDGLER